MASEYKYADPDELLAAIYAEQGYIVLGSLDHYKIGDIAGYSNQTTIPQRVIAESDYAEWRKHCLLAARLDGCPDFSNVWDEFPYYYRTQAAD